MNPSISDFVKAVNDIDSGNPHSGGGMTPPKLKKMGSKLLMKFKLKKKNYNEGGEEKEKRELNLPQVTDEDFSSSPILNKKNSPEMNMGKYMPMGVTSNMMYKKNSLGGNNINFKAMRKRPSMSPRFDDSNEHGSQVKSDNSLSIEDNDSDDSLLTPPGNSKFSFNRSHSIIGFFDGPASMSTGSSVEDLDSNSYEKMNGILLRNEIDDIKNQLKEKGFLDQSSISNSEDFHLDDDSPKSSYLPTLFALHKYETSASNYSNHHFSLSPPSILKKLHKKSSSYAEIPNNRISSRDGSSRDTLTLESSSENSLEKLNLPNHKPSNNGSIIAPIKYEKIFKNLRKYLNDDETIKKLFLREGRFSMVSACYNVAASVTLQNKLSLNIFTLFEFHHKSIKLLRWAIENEIRTTSSSFNLFREDSIASKLMGEYAKFVGSSFLESVILPVIKKLQNNSGNLEDKKVMKIASKIVYKIAEHPEVAPFQLRVLCYYLQVEVNRKFNESTLQSLGAFLFLRFICPAICTPHKFGIVNKPLSIQVTKDLVKIAKLIQNLVNSLHKTFEDNEIDEFVYTHKSLISSYLSQFGIKTMEDASSDQYFPTIQIQPQEMSTSLSNLIKFLRERIEEIEIIFSNDNFWKPYN
eukprot:TRINITY_DN403_c1_g1_i1.p1 TRINITY_DN403_c1_g1~~TRINITY_DN403_c1_g1_i1.p1  ORF type:complete len:636 (-),score=166.47 TRINITY_DN403_c1_g1_i1:15-1922(-)